jgi:hypothetical protein
VLRRRSGKMSMRNGCGSLGLLVVAMKHMSVWVKAACIKGSIFGELLMHGKERMKIKAKTIYMRYWFRRNGKRYWI